LIALAPSKLSGEKDLSKVRKKPVKKMGDMTNIKKV